MGAWGHDSFENDAAGDWKDQLCDSTDVSPVIDAFRAVVENDGYVEVDESSAAVAAAEVVAALCDKASQTLPDEVRIWVRQHPNVVDAQLVHMSLRALGRVETDSEVQELWDETDDSEDWHAVISDLRARLMQCLASQ
jgi:uncharacterized protein DUF4259